MKRIAVILVMVAVAMALLGGCASPNASIGAALTQIKKYDDAAFQDQENAARIMQKSYLENGEKVVAKELENLLIAGKGSTIDAAKAEKAFLAYRDNMKAFTARVAEFEAQRALIQQKRDIVNSLMDSVVAYHQGADLQGAIIKTITQLAGGLEGAVK